MNSPAFIVVLLGAIGASIFLAVFWFTSKSASEQRGVLVGGCTLGALACLVSGLPVLKILTWPLTFISLVLAVVLLVKGRAAAGVALLVASLVVPVFLWMLMLGVV